MIKQLSNCGYHILYNVLNSMEYANIPQNRERLFIVGFLDSTLVNTFKFPGKVALTKTIHDCLIKEKVPKEFYYDNRFECFGQIQSTIKSMDTLYQWRRKYVRENMK